MQLPKVKVQPVHHPSLPYRLASEAMLGVLVSDAGAPLSGAERWMEVVTPHLPVDCYDPKRLAESLGRTDEPYIRDRVRAILTKLVDENIRNQESLAIVSQLHGDPWATGCLDRLREAGYRIRLLLIYCQETVMATRAKYRNLNAEALIERQRAVIDQATLQAAKGARVELLHSRKGPPCTRTPCRTARSCTRAS